MKYSCPKCQSTSGKMHSHPKIIKFGHFYRRSDSKLIRRFRCLNCLKTFSTATYHSCYRQNKRHKNNFVRKLLCSGISQRRAARVLNLNRKTIVRKLNFLAELAKHELIIQNESAVKCSIIEFDDMETFEHTKYKPLSITLAVESKSRRILGLEVSQMSAKGLLAKRSIKKYGYRRDFRGLGRHLLFKKIQPYLYPDVIIKSDSNPYYAPDVKIFFPQATHISYIGQRGSTTGQGELKKTRFDPLFSLNHTCAKFRADVNRLIRKTWCTTKKRVWLEKHLNLYAVYHNQNL